MLAIFGKIIGDLVVARWFPHSTWTVYDGIVHLALAHFIAIGVIIAVWAFNIFGIRPMKGLTYVTGGLLMLALIVFIVVPYLTGDWHSSNVHATFPGPWGGTKLAFVYLFILGWSSWAARYAQRSPPSTRRGTTPHSRCAARRSSSSVCSCSLPLGLGGVTGVPAAAGQEGQFYSDRVPDDRGPHARHVLPDLPASPA